MSDISVSILGLGIMGRGMALSLAKAGFPLTVWNRTRARAEEFDPLGVKIADTPEQAAEGRDVVITMLSDPDTLESVAYGPDGVIAGLKEGAVLIDCSTVDPATSRRMAEAAKTKGAHFLDAPVIGSKLAAETGELALMIGGDAKVIEQVRPVLDTMSRKIMHVGENGMGSQLKLCLNLIVAHMGAALIETLVMGAKAGLNPEIVLETIQSGMVASKLYEWKGACILERDFSTNFSLKLLHKDLNLIMNAAYDLNIPLPVTASVKELFGAAKSSGDPEADFTSAIKLLEMLAGVEVKRP